MRLMNGSKRMKKASPKSHPNSPKKRRKIYLAIGLLLLAFYWFSLPNPLFTTPYSLVLEDSNGGLLGARIATDGQWRFPASDSLPAKYIKALLTFEDKRFYKHPGVDILSLLSSHPTKYQCGPHCKRRQYHQYAGHSDGTGKIRQEQFGKK